MKVDHELEEMNERKKKLNPYELAIKQIERERFFKRVTGLCKSNRFSYLRHCGIKYKPGFYPQIPGEDHVRFWKVFGYNIITTEPYRLDTNRINKTKSFAIYNEWLYLESDWPGIWNPPDTIFILLSPPKEFGGMSMTGLQTLNKILVDQS